MTRLFLEFNGGAPSLFRFLVIKSESCGSTGQNKAAGIVHWVRDWCIGPAGEWGQSRGRGGLGSNTRNPRGAGQFRYQLCGRLFHCSMLDVQIISFYSAILTTTLRLNLPMSNIFYFIVCLSSF